MLSIFSIMSSEFLAYIRGVTDCLEAYERGFGWIFGLGFVAPIWGLAITSYAACAVLGDKACKILMSAATAFYILAVALAAVITALAAPEAWPIMPAAALAALASVFSAAALILVVGLAKPQLFKIRTGVGATQNLAYLLALLPSMALTFATTPFLISLDVETATIVISATSAAAILASVAAVLVAPRFLNREELIAPGD